jgi:hypothetical protein
MSVKYKKYLTDPNAQIPRRTLYRQIKKKNIIKNINEEESNGHDDQQHDFNDIDIQEQQYQTYFDSSMTRDLNRDEIQKNDIEAFQIILNNNQPSMDDTMITAILLTAFFDAKVTQVGFKSFLDAIKLITNCELPNSFNSCASKLLREFDEKLDYKKKWYCTSCKKFIIISQYERNCKTCLNRYA